MAGSGRTSFLTLYQRRSEGKALAALDTWRLVEPRVVSSLFNLYYDVLQEEKRFNNLVKRRFVKELNSSLRDSDRPVIVKSEIGKNIQLVNL